MRRAAVLLLALSVVASCSGSSGGPEQVGAAEALRRTVDAMTAADTISYTGSLEGAAVAGPVEGAAGVAPQRGWARLPVATASGGSAQVELRWLDDAVFVAGTVDAAGTDAVFRAIPGAPPWVRFGRSALLELQVVAYDPFALLGRADTLGAQMEATGSERVAGTATTVYEVQTSAGEPAAVAGPGSTVSMWVDGDWLVRRVRVAGPASTLTYDLGAFGEPIEVVAPPAAEVGAPPFDPAITQPAQATGPFEEVQAGTSAGVTWRLLRAPATNGGSCWRFDADPPLVQGYGALPDGTKCVVPPPLETDPESAVQIVVDSSYDTPYEALVAVVPEGTSAIVAVYADGTEVTLEPGAAGAIVLVEPSARPVVLLRATTPTGVEISCGPGEVAEAADLEDLTPQAIDALRGQIWSCLPRDLL